MKKKMKKEMVENVSEVYVAADGTEFEKEEECFEYEVKCRKEKIAHLRIESLAGRIPLFTGHFYDSCYNEESLKDDSYEWYKVKNKEDVDQIRHAFEDIIGDCDELVEPKSYPEFICIEPSNDEFLLVYYMSDAQEETKSLWKDFGYKIVFEELDDAK